MIDMTAEMLQKWSMVEVVGADGAPGCRGGSCDIDLHSAPQTDS